MDKTKRGIFFESEVAERLKSRGFAHVQVTKASRDYGADILAFKDGLEYVFQCKEYQGVVGFGAVKEVATAMDITDVLAASEYFYCGLEESLYDKIKEREFYLTTI